MNSCTHIYQLIIATYRKRVPDNLSDFIIKVAAIDAESSVAHLRHLILPTDANLVQRKVHAVIVAINRPLDDPTCLVVEGGDVWVILDAAHEGMGTETLDERQYAADREGRRSFHLVEQKPGFLGLKAKDVHKRYTCPTDGNQ